MSEVYCRSVSIKILREITSILSENEKKESGSKTFIWGMQISLYKFDGMKYFKNVIK